MEMVQDLDPLALPKYSGIQFDCSRGKQVCTTNRPGPDAWTALLKALTDDFPLNTRHTYLLIDMHDFQLDTSLGQGFVKFNATTFSGKVQVLDQGRLRAPFLGLKLRSTNQPGVAKLRSKA